MRRFILALAALAGLAAPALAMSVVQVAVVTPAYQAPGWTGWTPASLGSALKAQWSASSLSDGSVSSWSDSVGSLAVTAAGSEQPVRSATSLNGFPGVACDGTDDNLVTTTLTNLPTGSTAGEIIALLDQQMPTSNNGTGEIVRYGGTAASSARVVRRATPSNGNRASVSDATASTTDAATIAFRNIHVLHGYWSGTTAGGMIDGKPISAGDVTIASLNTGTTRLRICASNGTSASNFLQGIIGDIGITTTLSDADRQRYDAYDLWSVQTQFRLPWNHPYRFRQP